jgi:hypothetical protein
VAEDHLLTRCFIRPEEPLASLEEPGTSLSKPDIADATRLERAHRLRLFVLDLTTGDLEVVRSAG